MSVQNGRVLVHLKFDQHDSTSEGTVLKINTHSITIKCAMDTILSFDAKTGKAKGGNHWVNPLEAQRAYQLGIDNAVDNVARAKAGKKRPGTIIHD